MKEIIIFSILVIILIQPCFAAELSADALEAQEMLDQSIVYIEEMFKANFSTNKVNDIYTLAKYDFDSKLLLEKRLGSADYNSVLEKTSEIKTARDKAFYTNDELLALGMFLEPYEDKNLTETFALYELAKQEFYDERYDESNKYIQRTYEKLIEEQSAQSTFKAVYDSMNKTLRNFIINNWLYILVSSLIISLSVLIGYNKVLKYLIKRKIKHLEIEKDVIKNLIKDSQAEYFDKGKISETDYHIKVKKFGELVRDLDRQIPLLNEQLAKISKFRVTKRKSK